MIPRQLFGKARALAIIGADIVAHDRLQLSQRRVGRGLLVDRERLAKLAQGVRGIGIATHRLSVARRLPNDLVLDRVIDFVGDFPRRRRRLRLHADLADRLLQGVERLGSARRWRQRHEVCNLAPDPVVNRGRGFAFDDPLKVEGIAGFAIGVANRSHVERSLERARFRHAGLVGGPSVGLRRLDRGIRHVDDFIELP